MVPARNEAATVGGIVEWIVCDLVESVGVVDEVVVIDSDSEDDTGRIAREAGATVYQDASYRRSAPLRASAKPCGSRCSRYGDHCWRRCRSRSDMAWSWRRCWTPSTVMVWTHWPRWISAGAGTAISRCLTWE